MARDRDPFSLALQTLRRLAGEGVFAPDRPIVILDEARRLKLSTTPIREALAWLGGEGMIERAPNGGYMGLRQDVASVASRYRLRHQLLSAAIADDDRPLAGWTPDATVSLQDMFSTLVRLRGDDVLWRAYDRVARQLAWLAAAEAAVIPGFDRDVQRLLRAIGDRSGLLDTLDQLHKKLAIGAAAILIAARRPADDANRDGSS